VPFPTYVPSTSGLTLNQLTIPEANVVIASINWPMQVFTASTAIPRPAPISLTGVLAAVSSLDRQMRSIFVDNTQSNIGVYLLCTATNAGVYVGPRTSLSFNPVFPSSSDYIVYAAGPCPSTANVIVQAPTTTIVFSNRTDPLTAQTAAGSISYLLNGGANSSIVSATTTALNGASSTVQFNILGTSVDGLALKGLGISLLNISVTSSGALTSSIVVFGSQGSGEAFNDAYAVQLPFSLSQTAVSVWDLLPYIEFEEPIPIAGYPQVKFTAGAAVTYSAVVSARFV